MKKHSLPLAILLFGLALTLALWTSRDAFAAGHASEARIRVVHASPDAPRVDILANDAIILQDVPFGAISNYLTVPAGSYNLKVRPANQASPTVINADVDLVAGKQYTVVARNPLATIAPSVMTKNPQPAYGHANVKVSHWVTDAPAVNITSLDGNILISNLRYGETKELTVPAGVYSLQMRLASDNSKVVTDIANLDLKSATNYTALAVGTLDANDSARFQVKLILD